MSIRPSLRSGPEIAPPAVLFDSQVFAEQVRGGVTRYFSLLIDGLASRGNWTPVAHAPFRKAPIPHGATRLGPSIPVPIDRGFRAIRAVNARLAPSASRLPTATVYHPTWHHLPTVDRYPAFPIVYTVMDLMPEHYPEITTPEQLDHRRRLFERSDRLVCISEATRDALIGAFPDTADRARVIRIPVEPIPARPLPEGDGRREQNFVYIGKRGSYKDFETLVRALPLVRPDITVTMVGGGPLEADLALMADRLGVSDRLIEAGPLDDHAMFDLLARSSGLVSTSREEGFGLPPYEAISAGTRAIVTDIPVYRELYGALADFFPPGDAERLAERLELHAGAPVPERPENVAAALGWRPIDAMVADFETVYSEALNASSPG